VCSNCNRRVFLAGFASPLFGRIAKAQFFDDPFFCSWSPAHQRLVTHSSSGNRQIDQAMIAEIRKILAILPINPGFKFIDDVNPNAFATQDNIVPNTQGTVYIGLNLIGSEFSNSNIGGVAVAGICAHECGHIYQYYNGYMQTLAGATAILVELHADFIAGFYFGRDRSYSRQSVETFARSLFSKGDYNFNNPQHHGTPQQRVDAMSRGYDLGISSVETSRAIQQGSDLVRQIWATP
jgi:hypothetical protein